MHDRSPLWHHQGMDSPEHLVALRREGEAFAAACVDADLSLRIAACPRFWLSDLIWHVTWVHDLFRFVVHHKATWPKQYERPTRPNRPLLLPTYRMGFAALMEELAAADPSMEVWTFTDDHSVRFVIRRLAHETAVHRWDAETAVGLDATLDPELASDGIDEFLTHFARVGDEDAAPIGGSVHVHCTDVPGEWTFYPGTDESGAPTFELVREHAKGDCALRGTASDLLLAMWRRVPIERLDVVGDAEVAARFLAYPRLK
jgi:uncharacterized protein (TIGR03083 family)